MIEESSEPKIGPTEDKMPTTMCINHADMPGLSDAALGTRVKFMVTGKVVSNRAKDKYSDGSATIEISSMEDEATDSKKNAATMHLSDLKEKISKKEETKSDEE